MWWRGVVLLCVLLLVDKTLAQKDTIIIGGLFPLTGSLSGGGVEREAAARIAVETINNDPDILPNTELIMVTADTGTSQAIGLTAFLASIDEGAIAIVGAASSSVSQITAIAGSVFDIPQISYSSTLASLSSVEDYPLFGRIVPPDDKQGAAFAHFIAEFGWEDTVSAISTADDYGVGGVDQFISQGENLGIRVNTYQQFLVGAEDINTEIRELALSKSRVFLAFMIGNEATLVLEKASESDLVGRNYVWLCSDGCAQTSTFTDDSGDTIPSIRESSNGLIGFRPSGGQGELFETFLDDWETRDPDLFPGAGDRTTNLFAPHAYDAVWSFALAFDQLINENKALNSSNIVAAVRSLDFTGLTGNINFEPDGDRRAIYEVANLRDNDDFFTTVGTWANKDLETSSSNGFTFTDDIQFFDGTTNIPDLDVQPPFDYWDCEDKKMRHDPTGKEIDREVPDGDNPRFIADNYRCDQYIDCGNMSDESFTCGPSLTATFLSFGIITGMLILSLPFFAACAIAFGFIWKKRRIRLLSPIFLLGMCFAAFIGYSSTFAWYGKPHTVSCNFQPWLLGISVNLMIAFLFAKTFRIWRIFKSPFKRQTISDFQLLLLVGLIMVPCVLILTAWAAFSTPTATIKEVDGEDHFVCETGGLTGPPGGIVFFSVLVAYTAIILMFGVFLAFVTRNVPEEYSESKLVGYSVYNLAFLGAAVIPVFIVLRNSNPVAAWIIRTIAILYGFSATLWLQFVPPLVLLLFNDKCSAIPPVRDDGLSSTATASMG